MSFTDLNLCPPLLKALGQCGFETPTPIQTKTIPQVLGGNDIIGSAETGTGKTAAFMLPALQRLSTLNKGPKGAPRVLVLTPTRELAQQVMEDAKSYGRHIRFRSGLFVGGVSYRGQFRVLSGPVDLVVATPGRLIDHLNRKSIDLSQVEMLVLDEADRMLDMGFAPDVEHIAAATPKERQTLLFTATLNRGMEALVQRLLREPVTVDITPDRDTTLDIKHRVLYTDSLTHKHQLLEHVLEDDNLTQAIIFAATKLSADGLARTLKSKGHRAAALHGDMSQKHRNRTVTLLREGKIGLLVATDVAARGLDVAGISHVINFDLPQDAQDYVHRIGRTGRAGASGTAISFATPGDLAVLLKIQNYIGRELPREVIPGMEPTFSHRGQSTKNSTRTTGGWRGTARRTAANTTWKDARRSKDA